MTTNPSSDQQFLIVGKLYAVWEWDNDEAYPSNSNFLLLHPDSSLNYRSS